MSFGSKISYVSTAIIVSTIVWYSGFDRDQLGED